MLKTPTKEQAVTGALACGCVVFGPAKRGHSTMVDPGMGGLGGTPNPPLTKTRRWSWLCEAVCLRHGTSYHLNP